MSARGLARKVGDLMRRAHAYRTVFAGEDGQIILRDLIAFSRLHENPTAGSDTHATYFNLGMQRIVRRIAGLCNMSDAELLRLSQQLEEKRRGEEADQDD